MILITHFILTQFFEVDFEVPYRNPNSQNEIYWDKEISGFLKNKPSLVRQKGRLINDYKKKDQILLDFRYWASTEEQSERQSHLVK